MFHVVWVLVIISALIPQCFSTGQISKLDPAKLRKDTHLQEVFATAINGFNRQSNSVYSYAPYQVHSISHQVVAGLLYRFDITFVGTNCLNKLENKDNFLLINCQANEKTMPQRASLSVLYAPWISPIHQFTVISVTESTNLKLHDQLYVIGISDSDIACGTDFGSFKKKYGKIYDSDEEEMKRYKIFHQNFKKAMLMKIFDKGTAEYGVTQFSDLTEEEFIKQSRGPHWDLSIKPTRIAALPQDYVPPTSTDWRARGAVTEVKNQLSCGSCWAFSTTGNIEGQWFLKHKQLISLSEQQLVDCDTIDSGCGGGLPSQAYKAIESMGGLESESSYPYIARQQTCQLNKNLLQVYINDSISLSTSESDMMVWCSLNGPISIGINANAMQFYRGGISYPFSILCNKDHLDHGVLIVGYSVTPAGEPYWIVKNSWGASWGEQGYYLVYRGAGVCGLNKVPTSSVIY